MMQNLFKFSALIVVLFASLVIAGCETTGDKVETDNNIGNSSDTGSDSTSSLEPDRKKLNPEDAWTKFRGSEEELYTVFKYPSYWSLKKIPGQKPIPGVEKVERWCKFRMESLDASIEMTVLEGVHDLDKMIPQIKQQIMKRYSLKSFLESSPKLVEIDGVKAENVDVKDGKIEKIEREDEENLPTYKFTKTKTQTSTGNDVEAPNTGNNNESHVVKPNFELNFLLDDDDLGLDDDDDDTDDDDGLDLDDDDDDTDDDDGLDLDDDDDDTDDDDDLGLDDDDDDTDDDDDEFVTPGDEPTSKNSKIFKRNEAWLQGKEMWNLTRVFNVKSQQLKAYEYEGRFVYDQKLYLVKVFAVNRIADDKTYYSIFVCEAENFVRYEKEYTETVQSVKFDLPKKGE